MQDSSAPINNLYAITDCANMQGDQLYRAVHSILLGGCKTLQYRDKTTEHERRLTESKNLQEMCSAFGANLIINDDIALAHKVGAAGVHLGQSDQTLAEARATLGLDATIGVTCHDRLELAQAAIEGGANYIAFGRFFPSQTKPHASQAPLSLLSQARHLWPTSTIVAIGGITLHNADQALAEGANLVAICHDVCHSPDPEAYCRHFNRTQPPPRML